MTEAEEKAAETSEGSQDEDLVAEVAAHDEALAMSVRRVLDRVADLEAELDETTEELADVTERLEHNRADFQNYKKRAKRQQEEIKERATEDLVERLLDVRDNLDRALDEESGDIESLREGVKLTRKQFDRVLDAENVKRIDPEPGTEVDANRHEVMMRVESDEPANTIASVYRPGYEMGNKVLRAAQVTVSEGDEDSEDEPEAEATDSTQDETEEAADTGEGPTGEESTDEDGTDGDSGSDDE